MNVSEQAGWQGDSGLGYQAWQAQWNQAAEQLVLAYRAIAGTHKNNTTSMLARDHAEAPSGAAKDRASGVSAHTGSR